MTGSIGMDHEPGQRWAALRASDADRERIVSALREHHTQGRLTVEEFTERMQHAYNAKTFGELDLLTRDLPPLPPPLPQPTGPNPATVAQRRFYQHLLSYTLTNVLMVAIWAVLSIAAGHLLFFWPLWTLLGWGLALGSHAIRAFGPQEVGPAGTAGSARHRRHRSGPGPHVYR
jgi:Domain of unknown function (DUF1707)/2TM domain